MSWIQRLYDTYENNISQVGVIESEDTTPLLPIYHTIVQAQIEVVIDGKGNFLRAHILDKDSPSIIIPCTEESGGRAGKYPVPHPLCDKVQYLAGDYKKYGGEKWHGYEDYCKNLYQWAVSNDTHGKVKAIYEYVKKGTLIENLINAKVYTLDDKGNVENNDDFIRWCVEQIDIKESRVWRDISLFKSWEKYYSSSLTSKGFCQVLGKHLPTAINHPKNIYNKCANAKIISSNDSNGFTYRGRFLNSTQSYGVSYEVSQKAHNAVKWLISKQGYNNGKKTIICWRTSKVEIANIFYDTFDLLSGEDQGSENAVTYTGEEVANKINMKLRGYNSKLDELDHVVLMSLESVTDGRLSITYYQEMNPEDFIDKLEKWHTTCNWIHHYKKPHVFVGAPAPMDIANTIFGEGKQVNTKVKMQVIDRILTCITDGQKIPLDLVQNSVRRTVNRVAFEKQWNFDKSLSITCALYKKYCYDYKKEEISMALDKERRSRDYLYGRLLAIAQNVERWALDTNDENRLTNADRLMQRFSQYPFSTWKAIELALKPSFTRLKGKGKSRESLIDEIMNLFEPEDFIKDTALSGEFLLGYHCQRAALRKKEEVKC
ncbi:MAG: type I-C CRISPR-associated protein Cas8c/Csd1 [Epulopiscium sp.]|nr:type I-C CRISPR-associated protein Cas8c/Csd1 [Candidatus Epulonipiscium sp.]